MIIRGRLLGVWLVAALFIRGTAQKTEQQTNLQFGGAPVSVGMTVAQVQKNLATSGRHLRFLEDGQTALVVLGTTGDDEGQVTFSNGRATYAIFRFPETRDAVVLAKEVVSAIETVEVHSCSIENFTAHGTGGSHTDSVFNCGAKTILVMSVEELGSDYQSTHVEVIIGRSPKPKT